jgi:hypothetical protein
MFVVTRNFENNFSPKRAETLFDFINIEEAAFLQIFVLEK